MKKSQFLFLMLMIVSLLAIPFIGSDYSIDWMTKTMIYAIFALSLELLVGTTGLICFGQAAFFGIGAYAVVKLSSNFDDPQMFYLLPISVLMAGVFALIVGALSLRTKGVYFIMVTLAFAQMAYYVIHDTPVGGGTDGIYLYTKPALFSLSLDSSKVLYFVIVGCLVFTLLLLGLITHSRFGRALAGIRINELRMRALGYSTYYYKLAAFVISGMIAGIAGYLFAVKDGFVNPELLSWHFSGAVLIMIILGGLGHLRGAILGALFFALLEEFFRSEGIFGGFAKHWHLGLGLTIILSVAFLPKGIYGFSSVWQSRVPNTKKNHIQEGTPR
jgi:branched-chain amino acid transport system permease protein